jgi:hypothetical protein
MVWLTFPSRKYLSNTIHEASGLGVLRCGHLGRSSHFETRPLPAESGGSNNNNERECVMSQHMVRFEEDEFGKQHGLNSDMGHLDKGDRDKPLKNKLRTFLRFWEVPDRLPSRSLVTAAVGMSLSPNREGNCSALLEAVIRACAEFFHTGIAPKLIFSNRFVQNDRVVAVVECQLATAYGVPSDKIVIPNNPGNPRIRNTWEEAKFALRLLKYSTQKESKSILIVANHIHMRRALAAFRKLQPRNIELYWKSVRDDAYDKDTVQRRFWHPLFFLIYEFMALTYSKMRGWA